MSNMINKTLKTTMMLALLATAGYQASGQEYVSPVKPAETGKSPGMKVKLLSTAGENKTYMLVFASGDEVVSGLTEFAQKYNVKSAHYKGIGDAVSAKAGFYDYARKQFKVIRIDTAEITSFIGDVALFNGKPVAHTHFSGATSDGLVHGGHLLELIIGPTFEITLTTTPTPLYKKLNKEFEAGVIDPDLKQ
jgi:predicted DNA-binding protein with PD1-like motif